MGWNGSMMFGRTIPTPICGLNKIALVSYHPVERDMLRLLWVMSCTYLVVARMRGWTSVTWPPFASLPDDGILSRIWARPLLHDQVTV
jgi:hypothetical protein